MAQPLHFTGRKHLLGFLRGHAVGESVLHEAMLPMCEGCRFQQRRRKRRPVLLVYHSDGWLEVYGRGIDVRVETALHANSIADELFAQRYLQDSLPPRFRRAYDGGCVLGDILRYRLMDDEIARLQNLVGLMDWEKLWKRVSATTTIGEKSCSS